MLGRGAIARSPLARRASTGRRAERGNMPIFSSRYPTDTERLRAGMPIAPFLARAQHCPASASSMGADVFSSLISSLASDACSWARCLRADMTYCRRWGRSGAAFRVMCRAQWLSASEYGTLCVSARQRLDGWKVEPSVRSTVAARVMTRVFFFFFLAASTMACISG